MDTAANRFKWGITEVGKGNISTAAKRIGVSRATLYAWMRGEIGNIRAHNLARLCELTDKDENWYLFGRAGHRIAQEPATYDTATAPLAVPAVAQRLALAIKNSGAEIDELAAACGVNAKAVYGWLKTGRIATPHIAKIAAATGVTPGWLTGVEDQLEVQPSRRAGLLPNKGVVAINLTLLDLPTLQALKKMSPQDINEVLSVAISGYDALRQLRTLVERVEAEE